MEPEVRFESFTARDDLQQCSSRSGCGYVDMWIVRSDILDGKPAPVEMITAGKDLQPTLDAEGDVLNRVSLVTNRP